MPGALKALVPPHAPLPLISPPAAEYLSPELIFNLGHDQSSDLWALGVLIYEMVMASTPFAPKKADNVTELFTNIAMVTKSGLHLSSRLDNKVGPCPAAIEPPSFDPRVLPPRACTTRPATPKCAPSSANCSRPSPQSALRPLAQPDYLILHLFSRSLCIAVERDG